MQYDVPVRMRDHAVRVRDAQPAEHDEIAGPEGMHVDSGTDSHELPPRPWLRRAASTAAASARSSPLVILRFVAAPSMSAGCSPIHSSACAASLGKRPAA